MSAEIDALDAQERSGLIGVWFTPEADGQDPVVSLEMLAGPKRYMRIWLRNPDHIDWGWVLSDSAICIWRDADEPPAATDTQGGEE